MNGLHAPATVQEFGGEPVEQLGMGRPLAIAAKVVRAGHDRAAEVTSPDMIDRHTCRKRVVASGDPVGRRAGSAGFRRATGVLAVGSGWKNPRPTAKAHPPRTPVHRENVARGFGSPETIRERRPSGR